MFCKVKFCIKYVRTQKPCGHGTLWNFGWMCTKQKTLKKVEFMKTILLIVSTSSCVSCTVSQTNWSDGVWSTEKFIAGGQQEAGKVAPAQKVWTPLRVSEKAL